MFYGFVSRDQVIPKTFKRVVLVPLLGAKKLRVSITTDSAVTVKDDRPVIGP